MTFNSLSTLMVLSGLALAGACAANETAGSSSESGGQTGSGGSGGAAVGGQGAEGGASGAGAGAGAGAGGAGAGGGAGGAGGTGSTGGAAADAGPDAAKPQSCTSDAECGGAGYGCFAGLCRDKCVPYLQPCNWKPSGNVCTLGGHCVQCQKDADCPGTRYRCDLPTYTCVDKPFDPKLTKIGVFYHTWHCPAADQVHDLTQILAGNAPYGPYNASHWWGRPAEGYYCLSRNDALLARHATQLRDMGVDFVFVDVTNHAYNSNALNDRPVEMIIQPFTRMVAVWSGIPGAPRIVPWVPVVRADAAHPRDKHMVYTLLDLLNAHPGLQWVYEGKPLILVTENDSYPVDVGRWNELSANYTLRKMWANAPSDTTKWSYMERCQESPLNAAACRQRLAYKAGAIEQLPIATAYQADYMSHPASATPKHQGKTFRKQFETLLNNPETPIATITGWNEWVVGRWACGSLACDCNNAFDKAYGCFLDQFTHEYNRDIEPAKNATGDYYYRLVQSCIKLFRAGKRCTPDNAGELCCQDYAGPK